MSEYTIELYDTMGTELQKFSFKNKNSLIWFLAQQIPHGVEITGPVGNQWDSAWKRIQ